MQQDDITSLIKAIHEDRQAVKDKEKRDSWTKYVSLMIVLLAVITAYGSLKSGGYSSKTLLNQAKASDQWSYYQAKSIKRSIAELEARLASDPAKQAAAQESAKRYEREGKEIQATAESLEAASAEAAGHGPPLGNGIAILQIAIAIASVCLLTKRKSMWAASGLLGAAGLAFLIYGLYLVKPAAKEQPQEKPTQASSSPATGSAPAP